jgi:type I restriction enzyme S subunit
VVSKVLFLELIPKKIHQNQLKRSILETNDILFSIAGTIGRVSIVNKELNNSNCNQALAFIRLKDKNKFKEYVRLWFKSKEIQGEINNCIVQGVQANISLTVLGNLAINIPNDIKMTEWNNLSKPIYQKIETNNAQTQTLKQTRDTLLPKLMSGQLRVDEFKERAV